ncbi:MAG: Kelch repeat-containing protein [Dehalococcoidia bacterium]
MTSRILLALVIIANAIAAFACESEAAPASVAAPSQPSGTWSNGPPLVEGRAEVAAAVLDGRIYVGGGFDADGADLSSFEMLDPAAGQWVQRASIPVGLNHLGLAAAAGRVWVSGGSRGGTISRALYAYDPDSDTWTQMADMPLARSAHVMVGLNDRLYVIGGVGPQPEVTLEYTPATDRWERRAPLPAPREHLSAAAANGRIYAIGGRWQNRGNVSTVDEYDPDSDGWRARAPLPTARGGLTAATVNGRIHVVGGEAFDPARTFGEHEVYDPAGDAWASAPPMPDARHGLASAGLDGRFYVIAGGRTAGLSVSDLTDVFVPE